MQPMINIALRAIHACNEQVRFFLSREPAGSGDPDKLRKRLSRVESYFRDDISRALTKAYPQHTILDANILPGGQHEGHCWHISPVQNPLALLRGLPEWGFSIVCSRDGQPEHALVALPGMDLVYTASRGSGALHEDRKLRVNATRTLGAAFVADNLLDLIDSPTPTADADILTEWAQRARACTLLRQCHYPALDICRVAAGNLDAVIVRNVSTADVLAAKLIAREAGALFQDKYGDRDEEGLDRLVCATPKLVPILAT